mmetsp:Transcript_28883/g.62213  ORF Transcript_28883/g.62213 Transcript_28883/m.62213 type:complete len:84 (+) Transcript_28883:1701-1952(+)
MTYRSHTKISSIDNLALCIFETKYYYSKQLMNVESTFNIYVNPLNAYDSCMCCNSIIFCFSTVVGPIFRFYRFDRDTRFIFSS